jgi:hypothetical protein
MKVPAIMKNYKAEAKTAFTDVVSSTPVVVKKMLNQSEVQSLLSILRLELEEQERLKYTYKNMASTYWQDAIPEAEHGYESFNNFSFCHKMFKGHKAKCNKISGLIREIKKLR